MPNRHLAQVMAWYAWPAGVQPYSMGTGLLLPMILEGIAQSVGSWSSDNHSSSCSMPRPSDNAICEARIFGQWINTNSFAMYTRSTAMLSACGLILGAGTLADDPYWRKKLLTLSVYVCAALGVSFFFFPDHPSTSFPAIAAGISNVCITSLIFGGVCANAYLPILARRSASIPAPGDLARESPSTQELSSHESERRPLLARKQSVNASLILSQMSSIGTVCSFVSAVIAQGFAHVALNRQVKMTTLFALFSVWFAAAALPPIIFLPGRKDLQETREGQAPDEEDVLDGQRLRTPSRENTRSMANMFSVLKSMKDLSNIRNLLINWVIVGESLGVMPTVSILQARTELGFKPSEIMALGMTVFMVAGAVTGFVPRIQRMLGATNRQVLIWSLVATLLYPAFGASSIVNKDWGYQSKTSVYVLVVYLGIASSSAGYDSYIRAVYSEMIPPGRETSFFSVLALSDRAASFFGPLIVAVITQSTGRFDYAWLALLAILALSIPVLYFVDVDSGRIQARIYRNGPRSTDETNE